MSELRKQLEGMKREHQAARYPGDLAGEVLGVRRGNARWGWVIGVVTSGAVAAMVAIAVWPGGKDVGKSIVMEKPVATTTVVAVKTEETVAPVWPAGDVSLVPAGVMVVPEGVSAVSSGSMVPVFPSMSDVLKSEESSTKSNSKENS